MTDEPTAVVAEWLEKAKPEHPIAIVRDREFERALGVRLFPTTALIDPTGKLAYVGPGSRWKAQLAETAVGSRVGELWPADVLRVPIASATAGDEARAYSEVLAQLRAPGGGLSTQESKWLGRYADYLEWRASEGLEQSRRLAAAGRIAQAVELLERYAGTRQPFPTSAEAGVLLRELRELPAYANELEAGAALEQALRLEKDKRFTAAAESFVALYRQFSQTRAAATARARAKELVRRGKPGFRGSCKSCVRLRRACVAHAQVVEL